MATLLSNVKTTVFSLVVWVVALLAAILTSQFVSGFSSVWGGLVGLVMSFTIHAAIAVGAYAVSREAGAGLFEMMTFAYAQTLVIWVVIMSIIRLVFSGVESVTTLGFVIVLVLSFVPAIIVDASIQDWVRSNVEGKGFF